MMSNPRDQSVNQATGEVWLVGAGPGDPGLLTRGGERRLRSASVVVYDALANPALLDLAPAEAERVYVGKRAGFHQMTQDEINALLVERARAGHWVVRLKGGDPYVFGRGSEEVAACARQGVFCGVVPGVTAGLAALATAGIPATHRGASGSVTFITAHKDPRKPGQALDYSALAKLVTGGGTLAVYMGVGRLRAIAEVLTRHGAPGDTPAAVVQWGTLPKQRVAWGALGTVAAVAEREGVGSPAMVVVGAVAGLDQAQWPGLRWFEEAWRGVGGGSLRGQTVVVTRTRTQQSRLAGRLRELGAEVLEAPAIRVASAMEREADAARFVGAVRGWLAGVAPSADAEGHGDLLLTSANAVETLAKALDAIGSDARALAGLRIGVVGAVTAEAVWGRLRVRADVVAEGSGESLAKMLIEHGAMAGRAVLLPRADVASPVLPKMLREAGASVTELQAYRVEPAEALPGDVVEAFAAGRVDWVTFTSTSIASSLLALLGPDGRARLGRCRLASIGAVTSASMRGMGLEPAVEAKTASVLALADAMAEDAIVGSG